MTGDVLVHLLDPEYGCYPWEVGYVRSMIALAEQEQAEQEREECIAADRALRLNEPELWSARADTDPDWPPPELDDIEIQEPEIIDGLVYEESDAT